MALNTGKNSILKVMVTWKMEEKNFFDRHTYAIIRITAAFASFKYCNK